jgi:hypothetical protein
MFRFMGSSEPADQSPLSRVPAGRPYAERLPRSKAPSLSVFRSTLVEIAWARVGLASFITIVVCALLPTAWAFTSSDSYETPFPLAVYALAMRSNPMVLTFGLVAAVPYVVPFGGQLSHRYLVYTRTRQAIRTTIVVRLLSCVLVTFTVFFIVGAIPFLGAHLPGIAYSPQASGLNTPAEVAQAQATYVTFSELTAISPWVYALFFSTWLGLNAAVYATLALVCCMVIPNRLVGFSLPWVVSLVAAFALAVQGLEAYSPDTIFPFNLEQLPAWQPFVPFGVSLALAVLGGIAIVTRSDRLDRCQ